MSDKPPVVAWRRSLACHEGSCVEVAKAGSIVLVQDSKNPGVYQAWSQREWGELLRCIKVGWRDGFFEFADGCVDLGLDRHDHKLSFTAAEWKAFEEDVIDDRFEFDKLREFGELSEGVGAGSGSVAGSGEAATGAVDGSGWSSDGPGSPVPVAAEQSLDDELDITLTGPPPVNPLNIGERRDHDPTSNPASRVLPEAAQPFDSPAGRPVDVSTDEVDLSFAVQPGSDAAGTGVPPDPVPVAQPDTGINFALLAELATKPHPLLNIGDEPSPWWGEVYQEARNAHHLLDMVDIPRGEGYASDLDARTWLAVVKLQQLAERLDRIAGWHARITGPSGTFDDHCRECGGVWPCDTRRMATGTYVDDEDEAEWARAVAPLVPTDGVQ
jgi:hypothetical protein